MSALTIRMQAEKYGRRKALSRRRHTGANQFGETATLLLAEADAETHFLLRAQRGKGKEPRGLALLENARGHGGQSPNG